MLIPQHRVVLLGRSESLWHKNDLYLRHVADLFLNFLVRGGLLLHLVSQRGQRLVQGIGFPLGLMNGGREACVRQGQRAGRDEERKRSRAVEARRERKR